MLQQETCPLGVLLVIFESRPDVLPQVAALAIRSGNGVLMKGGSESVHCVDLLHSIVTQAVVAATKGVVHGDLIGLVHSRQQVCMQACTHWSTALLTSLRWSGEALVEAG